MTPTPEFPEPAPVATPSLVGSVLRGAVGFMGVSVAGFSVWAFAGRWFYQRVGEAGLYAAIALVFVGLSGTVLSPLLRGPRRFARFQVLFIPGFVLYAVAWCAFWFLLGAGPGEWLGSFAGSLVFAAWVCLRLRNSAALIPTGLVLSISHSAGYFLGGLLMGWMFRPETANLLSGLSPGQVAILAKLSWGIPYGLGFGAGLGYLFYAAQSSRTIGTDCVGP